MQKIEVSCEYCKKQFTARVADRNRGWARFCSKSCKARQQEKNTGQYAELKNRTDYSDYDPSWDSHKAF
jgi:hypothetical protein